MEENRKELIPYNNGDHPLGVRTEDISFSQELENVFPIEHQSKRTMLCLISVLGSYTHAARVIGVSPMTHKRWLDEDFEYSEMNNIATDLYKDFLEGVARDRAVNGWIETTTITKPDAVETRTVTKFDNALLKTLLEAERPEKFGKRIGMNHSMDNRNPFTDEETDHAYQQFLEATIEEVPELEITDDKG